MPTKLIFEVLFFSIFMLIIILFLSKKSRISVKYAIVWIIPLFIIALPIIFTKAFVWISRLLGFQTLSNFIFSLLIASLIFISMSLTIIVTQLKNQVRVLIQEISLLKEKEDNGK